MMDVEDMSAVAIGCGLRIYQSLGPGMLESAYEAVLSHALQKQGMAVSRQSLIPIWYDGEKVDAGFRADLLVEDKC